MVSKLLHPWHAAARIIHLAQVISLRHNKERALGSPPQGDMSMLLRLSRAAQSLIDSRGVIARDSVYHIALLLLCLKFVLVLAAASFMAGGVEGALCHWDCTWYLSIINHGYNVEARAMPGQDLANWAFFPLYPGLSAIVAKLTGLPGFWSGTLVSFGCSVGFAIVSVLYRIESRPASKPENWPFVLVLYPLSLYFLFVYTESIYAFLQIILLYNFERKAQTGTVISAGLLAATRPTGVLSFPFITVVSLYRLHQSLPAGLNARKKVDTVTNQIFLLLLMPLGLALFMLYLYHLVGDPLAFSHVEISWGRVLHNPLKQIWWALNRNDFAAALRGYSAAFEALMALLGLGVAAWLAKQRHWFESWMLAATILLAFSAGPDSILRYTLASPVFLLGVGDFVDWIKPLSLRLLLAFIALLAQAYFFADWFHTSRFLM
jgi:hypothetical protein